jgi:hypothetical protein
MTPIGEPNMQLDQFVIKDMHNNLKIETIHTTKNYPCILDDNQLAG